MLIGGKFQKSEDPYRLKAVAPLVLFLPLIGTVLLLRAGVARRIHLYAAIELGQLGPVYEGAAALIVLQVRSSFMVTGTWVS